MLMNRYVPWLYTVGYEIYRPGIVRRWNWRERFILFWFKIYLSEILTKLPRLWLEEKDELFCRLFCI